MVGRSRRIHYISRTTYLCSNPACCGNTEDGVYVKVRRPVEDKVKISQECFLCGNILLEQFNSRDTSTKEPGL